MMESKRYIFRPNPFLKSIDNEKSFIDFVTDREGNLIGEQDLKREGKKWRYGTLLFSHKHVVAVSEHYAGGETVSFSIWLKRKDKVKL